MMMIPPGRTTRMTSFNPELSLSRCSKTSKTVIAIAEPEANGSSSILALRRCPPMEAILLLARQMLSREQSIPTNLQCPSTSLKRSEEHTSELQSRLHLVCRLLLEKKKTRKLQPHRR